jgi:carotenoid cleavage dioxygenase
MIMNPITEKIPSADSTGAPSVAGNFAPLRSEVTSFDLEVIGRVPEELTGRFLRDWS